MKLNRNGRDELRSRVASLILASVPKGSVIKLNKHTLEELLFEPIVVDEKTGETVKLPVWTGDFLRRLDLSEVSFEDVAWSLLGPDDYEPEGAKLGDKAWDMLYVTNRYSLGDNGKIDFAKTNARIDFSKSWEAKHRKTAIAYCNFFGVDLSQSNMGKIGFIVNSDLAQTGLVMTPAMVEDGLFYDVDFEGVDMNQIHIDGDNMLAWTQETGFNHLCNLAHTGASISLNSEVLKKQDERAHYLSMMQEGRLVGTYINGKKILTSGEKESIIKAKLELYRSFKDSLYQFIEGEVTSQVKKL